MRTFRSGIAGIGEGTGAWRWPVALGVGAAVALWVVWYFTKAPCTMENAEAGLCNAGAVARFVNHQILAQCILLGLAITAVKGGYDEIMVSRERKRADVAEQRAGEAEERLGQERRRVDEMIEEFREERLQYAANQQAMLSTMAEISSTLALLLARQQTGQSSPEN